MSITRRNPNEDQRSAGSSPAPCSVERTHRSVIERKLLTALEDDNTVAALLSKQDLEDMIAALYGYEIGERKGNVLSWEAHMKRRKELADSMSQLLREAFPPNESSSATRILLIPKTKPC